MFIFHFCYYTAEFKGVRNKIKFIQIFPGILNLKNVGHLFLDSFNDFYP